jgi:hypothetical protein
MKINPTYWSFEQAKILTEKGFDVATIYAWCEKIDFKSGKDIPTGTYILRTDGNPFGSHYIGKNWNQKIEGKNKNKINCSAPEQWEVVEWLLQSHKLWISVQFSQDTVKFEYLILSTFSKNPYVAEGNFNSPQEAYSAAFDYVLNNLI